MDNTPVQPGQSAVVDLGQHPTAREFVQRCGDFFDQIEHLTPGKDLEARLNREHGPGTPIYEDLCRYIRLGLDEGWVASLEIDGPRYRRGKVALPSAATRFFSITAVYMDSGGPEKEFAGQYHQHPYGEINCVVALDPGAQLEGMQGWQGPGWTSPGPGTHHYPRARGGRVVALFFLPAGRISYQATPDMPQPLAV